MINESDVREREGQKADFPMVQALGPAFTIDVSSKTTEPPQIILGIPVKVDPDLPPGTVALVGGTAEQPEAVVMTNVATEQEEDPALAQYPAWQLEIRKAQAVEEAAIAREKAKDAEEEAEKERKMGALLKLALAVFGIESEPQTNEVRVPGGYSFCLGQRSKLEQGQVFSFVLFVRRDLPEGMVYDSVPYIQRSIEVGKFSLPFPKSGTRARLAYAIDELDAEHDMIIQRREANLKKEAEAASKPATSNEAAEMHFSYMIRKIVESVLEDHGLTSPEF